MTALDPNGLAAELGPEVLRQALDRSSIKSLEVERRKKPREKKKRFEFEAFADIGFEANEECLIDGLLPRKGHAAAWGESGCGKSFLMLSASLHIAMGWQWAGRDVMQGL